MISDSSISSRVNCHSPYKALQQAGKAKIAVEVREKKYTNDIGKRCKGGESVISLWPRGARLECGRTCPGRSTEAPRANRSKG